MRRRCLERDEREHGTAERLAEREHAQAPPRSLIEQAAPKRGARREEREPEPCKAGRSRSREARSARQSFVAYGYGRGTVEVERGGLAVRVDANAERRLSNAPSSLATNTSPCAARG